MKINFNKNNIKCKFEELVSGDTFIFMPPNEYDFIFMKVIYNGEYKAVSLNDAIVNSIKADQEVIKVKAELNVDL